MKPITRRRWLMKALAPASMPGSLQAIESNEERIDFSDYKDFQIEMQAASPRVECYDLRHRS